jgi:hypothetical protein
MKATVNFKPGQFNEAVIRVVLEAENEAEELLLELAEYQNVDCLVLDEANPRLGEIKIHLPRNS